jgi:hypothetical protein
LGTHHAADLGRRKVDRMSAHIHCTGCGRALVGDPTDLHAEELCFDCSDPDGPAALDVLGPGLSDIQDHARAELDQALRAFGLSTAAHFDARLESERALWVNCRLASARADHELVYAVLDTQGWHPDRTRLSRTGQAHDVLRLVHKKTQATLVVIVKLPFGNAEPLEAA